IWIIVVWNNRRRRKLFSCFILCFSLHSFSIAYLICRCMKFIVLHVGKPSRRNQQQPPKYKAAFFLFFSSTRHIVHSSIYCIPIGSTGCIHIIIFCGFA